MTDLSRKLALPGAEVELYDRWLDPRSARRTLEALLGSAPWRQDSLRLFGKVHPLPRLQAWFGDPGARYSYSGIALEPEPWPACLTELRERLRATLPQARFNSALANLYRDGRDSNGWHSDDEPELGERPVIASVSLGAARRFRLRHRTDRTLRPIDVELVGGSLLVMSGATQSLYQHQLPKSARVHEPRVNVTFRLVRC